MSEEKETENLKETDIEEVGNKFSDDWVNEFALEELDIVPLSSGELVRKPEVDSPLIEGEIPQFAGAEETEIDEDPIFKELASPKLPELAKDNRARLLMQSPTRIQFYWSIKQNPFKTLNRAFGPATGSYTLVAKLIDQTNDREEVFPVEPEGSWWFNVDSDSRYQAEIGFYAPNRPFVRIMFSNVIETPRRSPSPRQARDSDWAISAHKFAEVLDESGFKQDAFEVALAGDDLEQSENATRNAFSQFIGNEIEVKEEFSAEEIRFALLAIASGYSIEDLRGTIGSSLFAFLQENAEKLTGQNALAALKDYFDVSLEEIEFEEQEFVGEPVFGSSLVHFPRTFIKKSVSPKTLVRKNFGPDLGRKLAPVSSLKIGV